MKIKVTSDYYTENQEKLNALGIEKSYSSRHKDKYVGIDLALLSPKKIASLQELFEKTGKHKPKSVLGLALQDISTWIGVTKGEEIQPRSVQQFAAFITENIRTLDGHRVFKQDGVGNWRCFYVASVTYQPSVTNNGYRSPETCNVFLAYKELGTTYTHTEHFYQTDVLGRTALDTLARRGYLLETPDLREQYLIVHKRFKATVGAIGKQFLAMGTGTDNLDGNVKNKEDSWGRTTSKIHLDISGKPTRIVIDVFHETDVDKDKSASKVDPTFWLKKSVNSTSLEDEENEIEEDENGEEEIKNVPDLSEFEPDEIPEHPICAVFDLKRHLRLRVHIGNLTEYIYDKNLGSKLVLPDNVRRLVDLLLVQNGDFKDIIEDKGGGAPILCAGPPGVGKTLTAEVYSEVMERPLYSVQCSQLGLTPEALERELLRVFSRSQRWNAILLLDEADVYVAARESNLHQNAIVGVFLRVLEYYGGALFLTTNRSDKVDDAIISRCIARIDYVLPSVPDQKKIWKILSQVSDVHIEDTEIEKIVEEHPNLSGRDIKNMIKLGRAFCQSENTPYTSETAKFVEQFRPAPGKTRND